MPGPTFSAFDLCWIDIGLSSFHTVGPICDGRAVAASVRAKRYGRSGVAFARQTWRSIACNKVADQSQERRAAHPNLNINAGVHGVAGCYHA